MFPRLILLAFFAVAARAAGPNIVFILADDLGIGDLGCYGQEKIKTPHIDRIAAEGMRFTQFYSGNAVCAPSRCALLTGRHMGHAVIRNNMQRAPKAEGQQPMPGDTVTCAQLLKKAGYTTAIVGKWGLGMPEDNSAPSHFGFDHYYGYLCQGVAHTYYPPYLWRDGVKEPLPGNSKDFVDLGGKIEPGGQTYAHDRMADDALRWVRDNKEKPFFLYLAFTVPHLSLQVPEDSLADYKGKWTETPYDGTKHYAAQPTPRAAYAAMVTRMDRDIGRLMALLKELALDEKTVVFFSSDNGAVFPLCGTDPEFFRSTWGLRGYKQDLYEGGIRTPFLARWPGHIQAGTVSEHSGAFWDMLPTFCELAGTSAPAGGDGIGIAPTLLARGQQRRHDFLYWEYHGGGTSQAVRLMGDAENGDWKAVRLGVKKNPDAPIQLYRLKSDPAESKDVAAEHPDVVARIKEIMAREHTPSAVPAWNF